MGQVKRLRYPLIGFILAGILSCKDGHSPENERVSGYKTVHIIMNSPYACYNEIQLDHTGSGISIFGYRDRQTGKTDIKIKKAFLIQSDSLKIKVDSLVDSICNRKPVSSTRGLDLYQFIVEIDGQKYVDKYGVDSLVNNILIILLPYVQSDPKVEQCDYFYFLKKIAR